MRMLSTLLEPSAGSATVLGYDLVSQARDIRRRLGAVLSGERSLYWKLTARENLEYFAALYHVPPREAASRIDRILEVVHLEDRADDYVEKFSTGMRQRLVLARALLPEPSLLLLDEPTVGLDPQAARDLRERVLQLRDEGRTVLLTTHYMEEADQLCDRIAIVDHGRIVALDTPDGLKRGLKATEVVRLEVTAPESADAALVSHVQRAGEVTQRTREDGSLHLTVHCGSARDLVPLVIEAARDESAEVRNIQVLPISLEDVFISLTGRALRE
jgi:ABC-2 type transport system ATP-binding protein